MTVEINEFSVSDEMLWVTKQTGRRQVDCSRVHQAISVYYQIWEFIQESVNNAPVCD